MASESSWPCNLGTESQGKKNYTWNVKTLVRVCRRTDSAAVLSKGLWCPTLHPQSFTERRTLESRFSHTPISTQPTDYFKWSGELQHTPTLSCSAANLFTVIFSSSPLPGGKSGFQAGKPLGKGIHSPSAMTVISSLAFARKGSRDKFLVMTASHPPARRTLAAHTIGQGWENRRAPQLQQTLRREKATPGMS